MWKCPVANAVNLVDVHEPYEPISNIPVECGPCDYKISLHSFFEDQMPYFFLVATKSARNKLRSDECPGTLVLASADSRKIVLPVSKEEHSKEGAHFHVLGTTNLEKILDLESKIDFNGMHNYAYVQSMWRNLEFDENIELANFVIENLLQNGLVSKYPERIREEGSLHILSEYKVNKDNFDQHVKQILLQSLGPKQGTDQSDAMIA